MADEQSNTQKIDALETNELEKLLYLPAFTNFRDVLWQLNKRAANDPKALEVLRVFGDTMFINDERANAFSSWVEHKQVLSTEEQARVEQALKRYTGRNEQFFYSVMHQYLRIFGRVGYAFLMGLLDTRKISDQNACFVIVALCRHSQNIFDQSYPPDSAWTRQQIGQLILKLFKWQKKGFPVGKGFKTKAPRQDPSLQNPNTPLEKLVNRIAVALGQQPEKIGYEEAQNYFVPAKKKDIVAIKKRFKLPEVYLEFLTRFSPLNVGFASSELLAAHELIGDNESMWLSNFDQPDNVLVIGTIGMSGDPLYFRLDLSAGEDAPLYTVMHDCWDEEDAMEIAPSFLDFLESEAEVLESIK